MITFLARLCRIGLEEEDFTAKTETHSSEQLRTLSPTSILHEISDPKVTIPKPMTKNSDIDLVSMIYQSSSEKSKSIAPKSNLTQVNSLFEQESFNNRSQQYKSNLTQVNSSFEQESINNTSQQYKSTSSKSRKNRNKNRRYRKKKKTNLVKDNKRKFGWYWCSYCEREWTSGFSWRGYYQNCIYCGACVCPYELKDLEFQKNTENQKPHISSLCERCKLVGDCRNDVYKYK